LNRNEAVCSKAKRFSPFCKLQTIHKHNVHRTLPLSAADIPFVHFLLQFHLYMGANTKELPFAYWDLFSFLRVQLDNFGGESRVVLAFALLPAACWPSFSP
jgi:hypothetical protein